MVTFKTNQRFASPATVRDGRRRVVAHSDGFTLIELLVAISVAGILLAVAIPSFTNIMISNRLTVTTNDYVAALNVARVQAIKRNRPAQFCSNTSAVNTNDTLGAACSTSPATAASVVSLNADGTATAVRNPTTLPPSILLGNGTNGGAMAALRYANNGIASAPSTSSPYTGLVVDVYSNRISTANHRCIYIATGSAVSSCRLTYTASTGCPSSAPATCPQ